MRLAANKETVDARVAPLLGRCARTVPCAPGREPAIVGWFQILEGYTCRLCFLCETVRVREDFAELHRVRRGLPFAVLIRFESNVSLRVPPIHGTEFLNLLAPLSGLLPCQTGIIFVRPQRIVLF
jgi:hypothetical protein